MKKIEFNLLEHENNVANENTKIGYSKTKQVGEKKKSISPEEKAQRAFSLYIRMRDCLQTTRSKNFCVCCSCSCRTPYESIECGHFISGRHNNVQFDEMNAHGQCHHCNQDLHGAKESYTRFMERKYGSIQVQLLHQRSESYVRMRKEDFEYKEKYFKKKLKEIGE